MSLNRLLMLALMLGGAQVALASQGELAKTASPSAGPVKVDINKAGIIALDARGATIAQVIDALAAKSGKPIRYQDAPDQSVSVSCHGQGLETVLRCLLGTDADLAFSYDEAAPGKTGHGALAGVKILSSTFEKLPDYGQVASNQDAAGVRPPAQSGAGEQKLTVEGVLAMARSEDPEQRARALDEIKRLGGVDQGTVRDVYESALKDADGAVRAEAVSGMALLDREGSLPLLNAAISDSDAEVRLAAVDRLELTNETRPLLEQALQDSDELVRDLAGLRLGLVN
jgi:hypothetical protein